MVKGSPIETDTYRTLQNILKSYEESDHVEILINEIIANGLDAFLEFKVKNPVIDIELKRDNPNLCYLQFHNNAPPMTESVFEKYHKVSISDKPMGFSIGYAGVGAKLFIASEEGGQVITITGEDKKITHASRMWSENKVALKATSKDHEISELINDKNYRHSFGTTYRAIVTTETFRKLKQSLPELIHKWWNHCLLTNKFKITINGQQLDAWKPNKSKEFNETFLWKKSKIPAICYISNDFIPESERHIIFTVHGKRIETASIENPIRLKENYSSRVMCYADVTLLGDQLTLNKAGFKKNWQTNDCRNKVKEYFWKFLEKNELVKAERSEISTTTIVNELTKKLDELLNTKQFRDLNPFLITRKSLQPTKTTDGQEQLSEIQGSSLGDGKGKGDEDSGLGQGEGMTQIKDPKGSERGEMRPRKTRGINVTPQTGITEHELEAFVDPAQQTIILDMDHPMVKYFDSNPSARNLNFTRILIQALIAYKSLEVEWDTKETMNQFSKLLSAVYSENK